MGKKQSSIDDTVQQSDGVEAEPVSHALQILFTPDRERIGRIHRLGQEPIQIGRKVPEGQLGLDDAAMSKVHAEVTWSPVRERYLIGDLRSSNGTHLNGNRIERELLSPGDIVRLGDTVLRLTTFDPDGVGWTPPQGSLLVGRSDSLRNTLARVDRAARAPVSILVLGETGTGKELIAQTIHQASERTGPLRALNCAAIPKDLVESELFGHVKGAFSGAETARAGLFRSADNGTLFLDEVGELAEATQAKLLRALETKTVRPVGGTTEIRVDVRVVAATNRDLEAAVEAGTFRADLYARLAEWVIEIAPLRERPDDLHPLWRHFLDQFAPGVDYELKGSAFEAMALHGWPYNVREMAKLVRNATLDKPDGGMIGVEGLPRSMRPAKEDDSDDSSASLPPPGETPTAQELRSLVEQMGGNIKEVAAFLGKDRTQVYRWLKRHGIDPDSYRK